MHLTTVISVRFLHRVWENTKHIRTPFVLPSPPRETPIDGPAKGVFEAPNSLACHRIDHLLMKLRVRLARVEATSEQNPWIVKINRSVIALITSVIVDYGKVLADRSWPQGLVSDVEFHVIPKSVSSSGIKGKHLQRPVI